MRLSKLWEGQGSLVCCSPWGRRESHTTEWLNNRTGGETREESGMNRGNRLVHFENSGLYLGQGCQVGTFVELDNGIPIGFHTKTFLEKGQAHTQNRVCNIFCSLFWDYFLICDFSGLFSLKYPVPICSSISCIWTHFDKPKIFIWNDSLYFANRYK